MTRFNVCKAAISCNRSGLISRFYCATSATNSHYDIVIAGGGMVGTTLACALGKNTRLGGKKILLLEGSKEPKYSVAATHSNRVSALNPATYKLLNSIDAWPHIADVRYGTIKKMQVWESNSNAMITFNNDDLKDNVAYTVENDLLVNAVTTEVKKTDNVTIVHEAKIDSYKLPDARGRVVELHMANGTSYTCNLLLGCDGANSKVRQTMGAQYLAWNYGQMGIVATVKLSEPTDNVVAWQRFLPNGVVALLPLNENFSSLVWCTTPQQAKDLVKLPEGEFLGALNDALWKEYEKNQLVENLTRTFNSLLESLNCSSNAVHQLPPSINSCIEGTRAAFPLGFGHSANYVSNCVALVGDAAHRVHPLAGQGVNLGFGDITSLNDLIGKAAYSGMDLGNLLMLKEYEKQRQRHNVPTMLAIDALQKLYSKSFTPFVLLRSIGLQFTHAFKPLKKIIISQAAH